MVRVELDYNPYLKETKIKFNGNEPRINSLVEKYTKSKLQSWIKDIPNIFHDEMNGFDFELLFSGTDLEFNELINVFSMINEKTVQVKLIHKNRLESRDIKIERITKLIEWLLVHENKNFDFKNYFEENKDRICEDYRYIILYAEFDNSSILKDKKIRVENIFDINELENTNLKNTPLLVCVDRQVYLELQKDLKLLLSRKDIEKEQLFFLVENGLNSNIVERTIKDLGIDSPNIVKTIDDKSVLTYLDVHPITEYINKMISTFENISNIVNDKIKVESESVAITNKDLHGQINNLDNTLESLQKSLNHFKMKDDIYLINLSSTYKFLLDDFENKLNRWRSRRTKTHSYQEAKELSTELSNKIVDWGEEFKQSLNIYEDELRKNTYDRYYEWYISGKCEINYLSKVFLRETKEESFQNDIYKELMELKQEKWIVPGKGLIAQFFSSDDKEKEAELQITWTMNDWKNYIKDFAFPLMDSMIKNSEEKFIQYADSLVEDYQNKLRDMIDSKSKERNDLISRLSNEEIQLENDNNWLTELNYQINAIEKE